MAPPLFEIDNLRVSTVEHRAPGSAVTPVEILRGVSLRLNPGEIHAVIGPEGAGGSALAATLLGSPRYAVTSGEIRFKGDDVTIWGPDVRAKAGMFLGFRQPEEIAGVTMFTLLHRALSARTGMEMGVREYHRVLTGWMDRLGLDPSIMTRPLNEGLSGHDKTLNEVLQMAILAPDVAILDSSDTGSDTGRDDEAMASLARAIRAIHAERPALGILAITRYQRLLDHLGPDVVHGLRHGRIVAPGGPGLAEQHEREGYESFR